MQEIANTAGTYMENNVLKGIWCFQKCFGKKFGEPPGMNFRVNNNERPSGLIPMTPQPKVSSSSTHVIAVIKETGQPESIQHRVPEAAASGHSRKTFLT